MKLLGLLILFVRLSISITFVMAGWLLLVTGWGIATQDVRRSIERQTAKLFGDVPPWQSVMDDRVRPEHRS
jgi:hypothetical protein